MHVAALLERVQPLHGVVHDVRIHLDALAPVGWQGANERLELELIILLAKLAGACGKEL